MQPSADVRSSRTSFSSSHHLVAFALESHGARVSIGSISHKHGIYEGQTREKKIDQDESSILSVCAVYVIARYR